MRIPDSLTIPATPLWSYGAGLVIAMTIWSAHLYFSSLMAFWLAALAALTVASPAVGLSAFFLFLSIDPARPVVAGIVLSFSELQLSTVVAAYFFRIGRLRQDHEIDIRNLVWGLPFLLAVAFSGLWNLDWYKVVPHLIRASEFFVVTALVLQVFRSQRNLRFFGFSLAGAALLYPGLALLQPLARDLRIFSTFGNANQFAGYLAAVLPFLAIAALTSKRRAATLGWFYLIALVGLTLLLTVSRWATVSGGVGLLAVVGLHLRQKKPEVLRHPLKSLVQWLRNKRGLLAAHLLALVALLALFLWQDDLRRVAGSRIGAVTARLETNDIEDTIRFRWVRLRLGAAIAADHPILGIGPGRWDETYPGYLEGIEDPRRERIEAWARRNEQERVDQDPRRRWREDRVQRLIQAAMGRESKKYETHVHNLALQLMVDLGLLGLAGFLVYLGWAVRTLWAGRAGPWCAAGLALLTGFLLHNLVDSTFPSLALELGFLLGIALGSGVEEGL